MPMNSFFTRIVTVSNRRFLSLALLSLFCAGNISCADESVSGPGFAIGDTSAETEYRISSDRTARFSGTGFQAGDIIRLTDTGISGNTYHMKTVPDDTGATITLPDNFISGEYFIFVVRGTKAFHYGQAVFHLASDDPDHPDSPDYTRLTAEKHPRLLINDTDFASLMTQVKAGTNPALTRLHEANIRQADNSGMAAVPLAYTLDAANKRILAVSSAALLRIFSCAYAYRATGDKKYLDHAENDIKTVCAFADWNAQRHFLDVGEMAAAVALGYDWLYADLSAETRAAAENALREYAFKPAQEKVWNVNFYTAKSNWNQVCNAGLTCAALAIYETCPETALAIIEASIESNRTAVEAIYAPDGNYTEGYGYWEYGTVFQTLMLTALETATGSDAKISEIKGFDRTAKWLLYMVGMNNKCFNFSDNGSGIFTAAIPNWYFADKLNNPSLLYNDLRMLEATNYNLSHRLLPMLMAFAGKIDLSNVAAPTEKLWAGAGKTPVVLVHTNWKWDATDKYLGIKGGSAGSSHAHMDAGSFVYDAYGVRWSMDMNRESYAPLEVALSALGGNLWTMSQGSMRWSVSRLNNLYHSTISINEARHQVAGSATLKQAINTPTELGGTFDLTTVLADQAASALRTVKLVNDKDLVVIDAITALSGKAAKVRWTMCTPAVPTVESNRIALTSGGKTMYLSATADNGTAIAYKTWSTEPVHSYDSPNPGVYLVGFEASVAAGKAETFTATLTPAQ